MKTASYILEFWFSETAKKYWFKSTDAFDAKVRIDFEATAIALAGDQELRKAWENQGAESHLALIIALDQFPRNMYRDTLGMFAWDKFALGSAKRLVKKGEDLQLSQDQRPFVYMPYMHSETLVDQETCVELCDARLDNENTLTFAIIHYDIIKRFGRFPHRNSILGRETNPSEQAFLDNGGFSG